MAGTQSPEGSAKKKKRKRKLSYPWAYLAGAIIISAATFFGGRVSASQPNPRPTPAPTVTVTPGPTALRVPLGFTLTSPARVPWCSNLDGTGSVPEGDSLLLFDSGLNPNGQQASPAYYHYDGSFAGPSSASWRIPDVYIGDQHEVNLHDMLFGILVSNQTTSFVQSILPGPPGPKAFWVSTHLPPGLVKSIQLEVIRTAGSQHCSPSD